MDDLGYLFTAFAAVWVVIFAFIVRLSRKQKELHRELESIEEQLEER